MERANALRRNIERSIEATLIVIFLLLSIATLGVALAFRWARVDLYQATSDVPCPCTQIPCTDPHCVKKGTIFMGLFNLQVDKLTVGFTNLMDRYETLTFNSSSTDVSALPVVVAGSLASAVLSFFCLFFAGINVWFQTKSILYGPTVVYYLCLFSSIFSVTALAAYLDFYIWILRDGVDLVPNVYKYLFDKRISYIQLTSLDWAFYVHGAGVASSVIAFALACRLAAVVLTVVRVIERTEIKTAVSPALNVPYEVMASDLTKLQSAVVDTEDDEDSLREVEMEPHFSPQAESSTSVEQQETTLY